MENKFKKVAKALALDPGFGFTLTGVLFFAGANPVGFGATVVAAGAVGAIKTAQVLNPPWLQKEPGTFTKLVKDPRTPLRMLGLAFFVVAGATISGAGIDTWGAAKDMGDFFAKGWSSVIVPAFTSIAYGICDFGFANSISKALKAQEQKERGEKPVEEKTQIQKLSLKQKLSTAFRAPETYMVMGLLGSGMMSGMVSVLAYPFVVSGYLAVGKNIINRKPEHNGHPKIHFAGALAAFGVVGLFTGQYAVALADFASAFYITKLEADITPGGARQVIADVKRGLGIREKHSPPVALPVHAPGLLFSPVRNPLPMTLAAKFRQGFKSMPAQAVPAEAHQPQPKPDKI